MGSNKAPRVSLVFHDANEDAVSRYLSYVRDVRKLSDHTEVSYHHDLTKLVDFLDEKSIAIYDVSDMDAREFVGYLSAMSNGRGSSMSANSINRILCGVRSFYAYSYRLGVCSCNPFSQVSSVRKHVRLPDTLSREEVLSIIGLPYDDFQSTRDMLMFNLLYSTGCRLSELLDMKVKDIDLCQSRILVMGKGSKQRFVFLTDRAKRVLRDYLPRKQDLQVRQRISDSQDLQALLVNVRGKRLSPAGVHSIFEQYQVKLGLQKRFTPHVFRHSFATHMIDNDSQIRVVQELLGHSSISTTQIYAHVSNERLRKVYLDSHPHGRKTK